MDAVQHGRAALRTASLGPGQAEGDDPFPPRHGRGDEHAGARDGVAALEDLDGARRIGLVGLARPAPAGSVVQVQRLKGTTWKPVAGARTDDTGRWAATLSLQGGQLPRLDSGDPGYAAGASQPLNVEP